MVLKALNGNRLAKYGYADELVYTNDEFHGHQMGISIGIINTVTKTIFKNYLGESAGESEKERNKLLQSIIDDESIIKVEKPVTMVDDEGNLVARTLWLLPYAVKDHTAFRETVNFNNIVPASNVKNHVVVELLFVEDNLNRYVTYAYDTVNLSIMEAVKCLFDFEDTESLEQIGIQYRDGEDGTGYYLDFYDEAGEKYMLCFERLDRFYDALVSIRLLEVDTTIEDD